MRKPPTILATSEEIEVERVRTLESLPTNTYDPSDDDYEANRLPTPATDTDSSSSSFREQPRHPFKPATGSCKIKSSTKDDHEDLKSNASKQLPRRRCNGAGGITKRTCILFCMIFGCMILGFLGGLAWDMLAGAFGSQFVWPESSITVGAYYYPWYLDDFHRDGGYLREQLSTKQMPALGEYDDSDPLTISQHLKWSAQANIRLWVTSWWGPMTREDTTTKDVILTHPQIGELKVALFYETTGRIKEKEGFSLHRVIEDIEYMAQNYFSHPNYYRINDQPVLFVYLTRKLENLAILDEVIRRMRQAARNEGFSIYIVGDHVFRGAPNEDEIHPAFSILDAVTNYDVYGSMKRPTPYANESLVQEHFERAQEWKDLAAQQDCAFIPAVSPGYNDRGVRPEKSHGPLSRRLSPTEKPGSLFKTAIRYARKMVDPGLDNLLMVNSFNEWHEDTQIEPVVGGTTSLPLDLTAGIEYQGYGEHYLNILREETKQ